MKVCVKKKRKKVYSIIPQELCKVHEERKLYQRLKKAPSVHPWMSEEVCEKYGIMVLVLLR